jgi:hypothetical protein
MTQARMRNDRIFSVPAILGSPLHSQLNRTLAPTYNFRDTGCVTQARMRNSSTFSAQALLGSPLHSQLNRSLAPT